LAEEPLVCHALRQMLGAIVYTQLVWIADRSLDAETKDERLEEMAPTKYGKYVTREIIAESKYPEITAPIARYNGCRGGGDAVVAEWSCITKPVVMDQEPEVDPDRDGIILIGSTNVRDGAEFHAEVEIALGPKGKKQVITQPACIYIPKGYPHGPVTVKSVNKPIFVMNTSHAARYSPGWEVKNESDCVSFELNKPPASMAALMSRRDEPMPPDITVIHPPDTPFRHARFPMGRGLGYLLTSGDLGWPAKTSSMYAAGFRRAYFDVEPVHAHRESHQISMYLGGDPLNIEDFGTEIDVFMGKELERQTLSSCGVVHYVPGCPHVGDEVREVAKPFIHMMWVIGPRMESYYGAAPYDKVQLSDESKGEVMITPGAHDYVPPTKMEDWVWPYPAKTE
jgi:hypothetical protein